MAEVCAARSVIPNPPAERGRRQVEAEGKRRGGKGETSSQRVEVPTKLWMADCIWTRRGAGGVWKLAW